MSKKKSEEWKKKDGTKGSCGSAERFLFSMCFFSSLLLLALFCNVNTGSVSIAIQEIVCMVREGIHYGIANMLTRGDYTQELELVMKGSMERQILFYIRIPRMLLAATLGGALSISGYLLQVFFRNPIAGPFVLGISSGAKMVVGITLIFLSKYLGNVTSFTLILAAYIGSLLVTSVVLLFSQRTRTMSMLLVIGIMVGYICGAVTDFCITFANDHDVVNLTNWSMGTFSGASWDQVKTASLLCIPGSLAALLLAKPIAVYSMGEAYARSMGVRIKIFRVLLILLSSLLSACVTALAGPISFVGIAVPHITRTFLQSTRPTYMIPATFFCGAVFCAFCDLIARTIFAPTELAIGTVTSVFGAPVVIYMMLKRHRMQEE